MNEEKAEPCGCLGYSDPGRGNAKSRPVVERPLLCFKDSKVARGTRSGARRGEQEEGTPERRMRPVYSGLHRPCLRFE